MKEIERCQKDPTKLINPLTGRCVKQNKTSRERKFIIVNMLEYKKKLNLKKKIFSIIN